jgi:hypothetical protein
MRFSQIVNLEMLQARRVMNTKIYKTQMDKYSLSAPYFYFLFMLNVPPSLGLVF